MRLCYSLFPAFRLPLQNVITIIWLLAVFYKSFVISRRICKKPINIKGAGAQNTCPFADRVIIVLFGGRVNGRASQTCVLKRK